MSSTYLELCVKFREVVGMSGSGPATVIGQTGMNKKITIWVADADELIQRKWEDWKFLLNTKQVITAVAGTATFTPADLSVTDLARWRETSFVRSPGTADYLKLSYDISYEEYLVSEMYLGVEVTGAIERVIIRSSDNAVIFYLTPAADTTVWAAYYKAVTRMTLDTSTTLIPKRFEDAILYRAKMFYAEHLEDGSLYESARNDYEEIIMKLEASQLVGFKGMQTSNDDNYEDVTVE